MVLNKICYTCIECSVRNSDFELFIRDYTVSKLNAME